MNLIREKRLSKGLKQRDIATTIGLSKTAISLYESGKIQPTLKNAIKIADMLGTTVEALFIKEGGELNDSSGTS